MENNKKIIIFIVNDFLIKRQIKLTCLCVSISVFQFSIGAPWNYREINSSNTICDEFTFSAVHSFISLINSHYQS